MLAESAILAHRIQRDAPGHPHTVAAIRLRPSLEPWASSEDHNQCENEAKTATTVIAESRARVVGAAEKKNQIMIRARAAVHPLS
jgi:hypothetical protein